MSLLILFLLYTTANGEPPPDGVPKRITHGINLVLVVLFEVMGIAGIVFAISCLIFNIAFRERK